MLAFLNVLSLSLLMIASSPPHYFLTSHCTLPPHCFFVAHFPMSLFFVRASTPFTCPPPPAAFFVLLSTKSLYVFALSNVIFRIRASALVPCSLAPTSLPHPTFEPPGTRAQVSPPCIPNTTSCRAGSLQALGAGFFRLSKRAEPRGVETKEAAAHSARTRGRGRGRAGRAGRTRRVVARGAQTRG